MTPESAHRIRGETVTISEEMVPVGRPLRQDSGPHPACQPLQRNLRVATSRTLRERFCSLPWRPFHHKSVRRWKDIHNVDIEGDGEGLEIRVWPGARPAEELEIDPHRFILDLGFLLVAVLGGVYVRWVWEPWMATLAALLP